VLSENVRAQQKIEFLENDFKIAATEKFEKDVQMMCNLSEGIERKGIEKGIEKGIDIGKIDIAKKALKEGATEEFVNKITGFNFAKISQLKSELGV